MATNSSKSKWIPIAVLGALAILLGILLLSRGSTEGQAGHSEESEGMIKAPTIATENEDEDTETPAQKATSTPSNKPSTTVTSAAAAPTASSCKPSLSARKDAQLNAIVVSWTTCSSEDFQFYKLLGSATNSTPNYPNAPVIFSTANKNVGSYIHKIMPTLGSSYYYRICVLERLQKVSCSNIVSMKG